MSLCLYVILPTALPLCPCRQLNTVAAGGATVFPLLGVAAPPSAGSALFWYNLRRSGRPDHRTVHASCPVLLGAKTSECRNTRSTGVGRTGAWPNLVPIKPHQGVGSDLGMLAPQLVSETQKGTQIGEKNQILRDLCGTLSFYARDCPILFKFVFLYALNGACFWFGAQTGSSRRLMPSFIRPQSPTFGSTRRDRSFAVRAAGLRTTDTEANWCLTDVTSYQVVFPKIHRL